VDVATGQVRGAEALIRWNHPQRGLVGPDAFIPTCESTGMINALGDWVFEQAARQQVQWAREGLDLKISVNLSPRQFRDPELLNRLARIVTATAAQPARLELELTEWRLTPMKRWTICGAWASPSAWTTSAPATPTWPT